MPTCRNCGHENAYGALSCVNCYALLVELTKDQPSRIESTDTIFVRSADHPVLRRSARHAPEVGGDSVALYIDDRDEPLLIRLSRQAVVGRYSSHSKTQPRVDLTAYGAFDKGISRMHAILRRTREGLIIEDLASANGTWLNSRRLQPYLPNCLRSGDRLRLGQIDIEIYFDGLTMPVTTSSLYSTS